MSNFLVPSAVVARRKNQSHSRPTTNIITSSSAQISESPPPTAWGGSGPPPGFPVSNLGQPQSTTNIWHQETTSAPPLSLYSTHNKFHPEGILADIADPNPQATPSPPPAGITPAFTEQFVEQPEHALIAFANTDLNLAGLNPGEDTPEHLKLPSNSDAENTDDDDEEQDSDDDSSEDEGDISETDHLNLQRMAKAIAKDNIEGSLFHSAVLQNLKASPQTLTQVLSILLGYPDLLNLFCTIQSQYSIPPNELLLELSNIGEGDELCYSKETGEQLFYYSAEQETALESALEYHLSDTTDAARHRGSEAGITTELATIQVEGGVSEISTTNSGEQETAQAPISHDDAQCNYAGEQETAQALNAPDVDKSKPEVRANQADAEYDGDDWENNSLAQEVEIITTNSGEQETAEKGQADDKPEVRANKADASDDDWENNSLAQEVETEVGANHKTDAYEDDDWENNSLAQEVEHELRTEDAASCHGEAQTNVSVSSPTTQQTSSQSSSSTSPTTVSTTASSDMEEDPDFSKQQQRKQYDDHNQEETLPESDSTKPVVKTAGDVVEKTAREDRNDFGSDNSEDRHDDRTKERDDGSDREVDSDLMSTATKEKKEVDGGDDDDRMGDSAARENDATDEKASQRMASPATKEQPPAGTRPLLRPQTTLRPGQEKPPLPYTVRTSTDAMAAVEFLCLLHKECEAGTSAWPNSQLQVRMFLTKITNCFFSKNAKGDPKESLPTLFCAWFEHMTKRYKKDPQRLRKIRKDATNQLVEELVKMECVKEEGMEIRWSQRKVESFVNGYKKHQREREPAKTSMPTKADLMKDISKTTYSSKQDTNIWRNQRKLEALVSGCHPKGKLNPATKTGQNSALSLMVLKKPTRMSGEKSLLSALPNQRTPPPRASPWKVAPVGSLKPKLGVPQVEAMNQRVPRPRTAQPALKRQIAPSAYKTPKKQPTSTSRPRQATESKADKLETAKAPCSVQTGGHLPNKDTKNAIQGPQSIIGTRSETDGIRSSLSNAPAGELHISLRPSGAFTQVQASPIAPPSSNAKPVGANLSHESEDAPTPLQITNEVPVLLELLPKDLATDLADPNLQQQLTDIVLDKGRQPVVWASGVRTYIGEEGRVVTAEDIDSAVEKLGGFGDSNRVGLDQQLHSISAIRNRKNDIIGLSMGVGRHISGIATMISDLLFSDPTKSILFLGEPGSGKTTILREVTRLLAKESDVMIVDSVNEIAGDGDVPHPCVGQARRMMVSSLAEQAGVMVECVQNHSPDVMVVDKLGSPDEVMAALGAKDSGVRLISSMNGNLLKLVKNAKLQGLMGVETVVLGQPISKASTGAVGGTSKSVLHRTGTPAFDYVVELCPGTHHEWKVVLDTGTAVDSVLRGETYKSQQRIRENHS